MALLALSSWLCASPGAEAANVRVAVIHSSEDDASARRLRAEASAAGLDAVDVVVSPTDLRATDRITRDSHAQAAVRMRKDGELEIVVMDPTTGNLLDGGTLYPGNETDAPLVVRAVEELRAKLVKFLILPSTPSSSTDAVSGDRVQTNGTAPGAPPTSTTSPPAEAPAKSASPGESVPADRSDRPSSRGARRRLPVWAGLGAGAEMSAGGLGGSTIARASVRVEPAPWSLSAFALLPISAHSVDAAKGSARADVYVIGAELGYAFVRSDSLEIELGFGGGGALCSMEGTPDASTDVGRTQTVASGLAFGDLSTAWNAGPWFRLRIGVLAGFSVPRVGVRFDGEQVATWGRPFVAGTLGFEIEPASLVGGGT